MKHLIFSILILGNLQILNALEIDNKQWMIDLKALVMMNSNKVDSLSGDDKNSNGVRDDIERYIWSKYKDDKFQRDMFFTAAKLIQSIITLPKQETKQHIQLDHDLLKIYTCRDYILYRNEDKKIEQEMLNKTLFKGKVLNTPNRLRAYIEHKKKLPLELSDLSEKELLKDKNSCLKLYQSYQSKVLTSEPQ